MHCYEKTICCNCLCSSYAIQVLLLLFICYSYTSCTITVTSYIIPILFFQYRQITNIRIQISYFSWRLLDSNFSAVLEEVHNEKIPREICWNNCYPSEEWSDLCIFQSLYKRWERRFTRGNQGVKFSFLSSSSPINTCLFLSHVTSAACNQHHCVTPSF